MIVLMAGLPGTGKTTLARELAAKTGGRILSKDEFRRAIFRLDEIEYSSRQDDVVLALMLETAGYLFRRNRHLVVLLDGRPFSRRYQIDNVVARADALHQPWCILECICPDSTARKRLEADCASRSHPAANRDFALYLEVKERFQAIELPKTVIDTSRPFEACLERALEALRSPHAGR
jgi:predicted kinase